MSPSSTSPVRPSHDAEDHPGLSSSSAVPRPASPRARRSASVRRWEDVLGQPAPSSSGPAGPQTLDLEGESTRAALRTRLMEVANPELASPHARMPLEPEKRAPFASGPFEVPQEETRRVKEEVSPLRLWLSGGLAMLLGLALLLPAPQVSSPPQQPIEHPLALDQYGLLQLDAPLPFQLERALRHGDMVVIWVSTDWENLDLATRQRGLRLLRALLPEQLDVQLLDTRAQLRGELYGNTYFLYP